MKAFAPVNIAWIKYMGKTNGQPTNSSFSMTLSDVGTVTEIRKVGDSPSLSFSFDRSGYCPPEAGQAKSFRFLQNTDSFLEVLSSMGLEPKAPTGVFEIETRNSVPAGTGIATSASGFAALTLAWIPHFLNEEDFATFRELYDSMPGTRSRIAGISASGSGSSCRSFHGPFVEWRPDGSVDAFGEGPRTFVDFVLILESEGKAVSSSEAHVRVLSSPLFPERAGRAETRLRAVKEALKQGDASAIAAVVLEEALDMHELFHTSDPAFRYLNSRSLELIARIREGDVLPSPNGALTFDAGANAHLFVPSEEAASWEQWLRRWFPGETILKSKAGTGAGYR